MAQLEATVVLRTLIEELDLQPAVDESAPIGRHSVIAVPNNGAPVVATRRRPAGSPKADSGVRS
jgi:cytochrome P450